MTGAGSRSLRTRLLVGATALATVAVLASQVLGYSVLSGWLTHRVDQQLNSFRPPVVLFPPSDSRPPLAEPTGDNGGVLPSDFRIYLYDEDGQLVRKLGDTSRSGPRIPGLVSRLALSAGHPETVPAASGSGHWRVLLAHVPDDRSAVVALPMDTVEGAMSRLLWLDTAVVAIAVLALLAIGLWVIRVGLLPLTRMERTAQAITEGNLDLRLPDTDARTEIGRLGSVLNTMLDRLQQALRARETSEARLRRFVADAGHELRTPLTAIQGYAELALRHEQRPLAEQREAHRLVEQNAERMRLIIDDLQLLATLDREPTYKREPVDLLSVAADAVATAALHSPSHPVDLGPLLLATPHRLEVVEALGDPHRIRQVVAALISNAHVHTPPGTRIHVRVGTSRASRHSGGTDRPGRDAASPPLPLGTRIDVIEIADEGPGLAPGDAKKVFERFYRADPSRSRAHGGSGLGLAIASSIAEGHGGRLELDTAPGRGCTFRLVLPSAGTTQVCPSEGFVP